MKVLFVLPARGSSGGANSVFQEVLALNRIGVEAKIAVNEENYESFLSSYAATPNLRHLATCFSDNNSLTKLMDDSDIAVATIATTVELFLDAASQCKNSPKLAYYIQDYETLFHPKGSDEYQQALQSYNHGAILNGFAKTDWLCNIVSKNHNTVVSKVCPSIDHDIYYPMNRKNEGKIITAMIRPSTPRRAPNRTVRILNKLCAQLADNGFTIKSFGCDDYEFRRNGLMLDSRIKHEGRLTREQVSLNLRTSDLFLDLSDYQAFGRTGLEAMACGSIPLVPIFGGAYEYIRHNENGFAIDVRNDDTILTEVNKFIELDTRKRSLMVRKALETAADYSSHKAAISLNNFFASL